MKKGKLYLEVSGLDKVSCNRLRSDCKTVKTENTKILRSLN